MPLSRRLFALAPPALLFADLRDPVDALMAWREAMLKPDLDLLEQVLHEELQFSHSNGKLETKQDILNALSAKQVRYLSIEVGKQTLVTNQDMALLRGDMTIVNARGEAAPATWRINVLHVFVREKRVWRMIARQATRLG
ncbi:MAG: nuclear transport factor 2 family protein [Bryobacter sp.]|nr:nuclear transport factor 2 family protein [Bryobacter sp.]